MILYFVDIEVIFENICTELRKCPYYNIKWKGQNIKTYIWYDASHSMRHILALETEFLKAYIIDHKNLYWNFGLWKCIFILFTRDHHLVRFINISCGSHFIIFFCLWFVNLFLWEKYEDSEIKLHFIRHLTKSTKKKNTPGLRLENVKPISLVESYSTFSFKNCSFNNCSSSTTYTVARWWVHQAG